MHLLTIAPRNPPPQTNISRTFCLQQNKATMILFPRPQDLFLVLLLLATCPGASSQQGVTAGDTLVISIGPMTSIEQGSNNNNGMPESTGTASVHLQQEDDSGLLVVRSIFVLQSLSSEEVHKDLLFLKSEVGQRTTANGRGRQTIWHGGLADGIVGEATFLQDAAGHVTGSFTSLDTAFFLATDSQGTIRVRAVAWKNLLDSSQAKEVQEEEETRTEEASNTATLWKSCLFVQFQQIQAFLLTQV